MLTSHLLHSVYPYETPLFPYTSHFLPNTLCTCLCICICRSAKTLWPPVLGYELTRQWSMSIQLHSLGIRGVRVTQPGLRVLYESESFSLSYTSSLYTTYKLSSLALMLNAYKVLKWASDLLYVCLTFSEGTTKTLHYWWLVIVSISLATSCVTGTGYFDPNNPETYSIVLIYHII